MFLVFLALLSVVAALLLTAARPILNFFAHRQAEPTADWLSSFDFSRYAVLATLLHPRDFEFLKAQPGYAPELGARLRSERLKIAEVYLHQLERDVRLLLNFANHSVARSGTDHDGLSAFLLKKELRFAFELTKLRVALTMMRLGVWNQISFDALFESVRPLVVESRVLALSH
jgi:hypothetical protein